MIDLCQRPRDLDGTERSESGRQDADVDAVDGAVLESAAAPAGRDPARVAVRRDTPGPRPPHEHLSGRRDQLHRLDRSTEGCGRRRLVCVPAEARLARERLDVATTARARQDRRERRPDEPADARLERAIHLPAQLGARSRIHDRRHRDDRERDRRARDQAHAGAQAHVADARAQAHGSRRA